MLKELLGGLGGKVVDAVSARGERKHEEKVKKLEIEAARHKTKLEMAMKGQQMDNSWELEQIRNSGWKDEFVLLILSAPIVVLAWAVFSDDPAMMEKIELFFHHFGNLQFWFQTLWITVVASIFGIKGTQIFKNGGPGNKK